MVRAHAAGVVFFQYRAKNRTRRNIYETALGLARTARDLGALFMVNDHADIAAAVGADGVHLGQDDLSLREARMVLGRDKIIGISTHSLDQAIEADRSGADYIGFGPIFPTSTKDAGKCQGAAGIEQIKRSVNIPVIAIGGIGHANVQEVIRHGADGVAVISALLSATDLSRAAADMVALIEQARSGISSGGGRV